MDQNKSNSDLDPGATFCWLGSGSYLLETQNLNKTKFKNLGVQMFLNLLNLWLLYYVLFCKNLRCSKSRTPVQSVSGVQHHLKPVIAFFRVAPWLEVAFSLCWYFHYFCAASAKKKPKGLSTVTAANTIQDGTNATAAAGGSKTREASNASSAPAGKTQNAVSAVCKAGGGLRNYIYFPAWWVLFLSSLCFPS